MSEATVQVLGTPLTNEEPFTGDGSENELTVNTADGRIWAFDQTQTPVELGGACINKPIGQNLFSSNYLELDVTNPDNLPIPLPDPLSVQPGIYRELRILIRFVGEPLQTFTAYFDYDVDWGDATYTVDPVSDRAVTGATLLIELCRFGPATAWMGSLLWSTTPN